MSINDGVAIMMNTNSGGGTYTVTLPPPSGGVVQVTDGIAAVAPEDVDLCMRMGWILQAGQDWPALRRVRMVLPRSAAVAAGTSYITGPTGGIIPINAAGYALVPHGDVSWARGHGFAEF